MKTINYGETSETPEIGDTIKLQNQDVNVIDGNVVNIDPETLAPGDLSFIKKLGLTITNPHTEGDASIVDDHEEGTFGHRVAGFFGLNDDDSNDDDSSDDDTSDDDDDSSFFGGGSFGGSSSFGGFGGGGFSGGGASGGF